MRTITLNRMHISNFKGIQNLEIALNGKNTLISGYNGVGKSTIADAYLWAVTGKNMASATRFEVSPRDGQGNEIHDVITSVECEFSVVDENGDVFTFTVKRDELEDLTKKEREQLKPETIAKKKSYYFIDNAPFGESIYYAQLAKVICDKDKLAVLSNPFAFFALDENKQREMLTAACGDIADSDIEGYAEVKEICGAINTPTDVRDGLKKSVKATEKRLNKIPARISGLAELCDEYADYDKQIAELEKEQTEIGAQGEKLKAELSQNFGISSIMLPQPPSMEAVIECERRIESVKLYLRNERSSLDAYKIWQDRDRCPNCGQQLKDYSEDIAYIENEIFLYEQDLANAQKRITKAQAKYDAAMQEYNAKVSEQTQADEAESEKRKDIETCIEKLRARYTELSVEIGNLRNAQKVQSQIKALRDEQRILDNELAADMTKLDIITAFILKKAEKVVENINKRFTKVKFKLYEMQANGELKTCCKAMKDGVSYANINTASKVQVGIELAKLFSEFYGVAVPLWVDDKESVLELPPTDTQLICLKVDERYEELHIAEM